jgi:hypothetical protein
MGHIFLASIARWNSFGLIYPSRFVSKSWKAWDVVRFNFRNMPENVICKI